MIGGKRVLMRGYGNVDNDCTFARCDLGAHVLIAVLTLLCPEWTSSYQYMSLVVVVLS